MRVTDTLTRASGRWSSILAAVGGISADHLTGKHGPCPFCGGRDRWRWDDHDNNGGGYCNKCGGPDQQGGAISGLDLIARARGITFPEAIAMVDEYIGGGQIASAPRAARSMGHRTPERPPADAAPPDLGRATHQWLYSDAQGPCYWIQRIPMTGEPDKRGKTRKLFLHRVWLDGKWHRPNRKRDGWSCDWPAPRPLLGFVELQSRPDVPVLVVEGETTRDAAQALLPDWVVVTWSNGSNSVGMVDWSPLSGRRVVIWPDADTDGAKAAKRITQLVQASGATSVAVVAVPDGVTAGWDLGDAAAEGWDAARVIQRIESAKTVEVEPRHAAPPTRDVALGPTASGEWPFTLLGFNGNDMFYQPGESGQVMSIPRNSHTAGSLMGLARIEFWEERFGRYNKDGICTGVHWQHAASELIGLQYRVGVYDPNRIRGVGAWWDESNVVYHLGDRLVISGKTWPVLNPPPSNYLYQRLPRRDGPGDAIPLADAEGFELLSLAERFHWEAPASGMLLAGWVALAPICGVLRWRPHIWLNAVAGSGKSSVMHYFVRYLLGDLPLRVIGATTEAGIRQTLKSDALPIMFDEAESNEKPDAARIQSILTLARISSTDDQGVTLKGSPSAEATMFNIRSMFFMSSINTALKQGADRSRFSVLVLRVPDNLTDEQRRTHWESLEADLVRAITPETGQRMIARMVSLAGMVREAATVMAKAAAIELGSARQGDQIGALLTGAWALQNRHAPSLEEAQAFIRASGVREQAEGQADERGGDQGDCLQTILQARVRVETGKASLTRTVAELIEVAHQGALGLLDPTTELTAANARSELARHGILVHSTDGSSTPDGITVSNTAEGIKRLLRDTPWSNGGWANLLRSLPGATRTASPVWFPELKAMARGTRLPQRLLEDRSAPTA